MPKRKKRATATASLVSSGDNDCTKACVDRALAARQQAQADYQSVREGCNLLGDATQRANCLAQAANALNATLQAVQAEYDLCRKLCDGRSPDII